MCLCLPKTSLVEGKVVPGRWDSGWACDMVVEFQCTEGNKGVLGLLEAHLVLVADLDLNVGLAILVNHRVGDHLHVSLDLLIREPVPSGGLVSYLKATRYRAPAC